MMKRRKNSAYSCFLGAVAALTLALPQSSAAATETVRAMPAVQGLEAPIWGIEPPGLYLAPRESQPFLAGRTALMAALLRAGETGPARMRVLIELAEFHFAHGMIPEALSILSEVRGPQVPPAHGLRAAALELALGLFDPLGRPLTERAANLLAPHYAKWPDQRLLLVMSDLRAGACAKAAPGLRAAFERLQRFPEVAREQALPALLECAIDDRQWQLARDIASRFEDHVTLHDSPALHFLLGKVAEAGDAPLAAFDSYALAQSGADRWGHRARRALVDLGLRQDALSSAEAADLLALETEIWRGDAAAADTLGDLAALQEIAGDPVAAVETYGRLRQRHPGTDQARGAQQKAQHLIGKLYEQGASGEISLSAFMALHARIAPWFRFTADYALSAERFADGFLAAGATTVAAQEFATIRDHLTAAQDLGTTEDTYFKVVRGKTAALFAAATEVGGILAGVSEDRIKALHDYGDALGIAFQVVDDLLDFWGVDATGKNIGDDFRERKLTLPIIKAIARGDDEERAFWKRTLEKNDQRDGDLERALEIMTAHGALDDTRAAALDWAAWESVGVATMAAARPASAILRVRDT